MGHNSSSVNQAGLPHHLRAIKVLTEQPRSINSSSNLTSNKTGIPPSSSKSVQIVLASLKPMQQPNSSNLEMEILFRGATHDLAATK
ncbi:hypothetical protein CEXT_103831 [Caerostris extrusa]|uniref:Uncharacterized protein n=1 Tax=Caerostris extrusa TaxID=172846 RepID=A0AAV4QAW8_CAEEX|nr:hypothetical protein CEXT_103831 [Caerostris extrusa]